GVAVALAPTVARAHPGHAHASHASVRAVVHPDPAENLDAVGLAGAELTTAWPSHSSAASALACDHGLCCAGAPCSACCGVVLPEVPMPLPPAVRSSLRIPDTPAGASCDPDGLRRPPKQSFA